MAKGPVFLQTFNVNVSPLTKDSTAFKRLSPFIWPNYLRRREISIAMHEIYKTHIDIYVWLQISR